MEKIHKILTFLLWALVYGSVLAMVFMVGSFDADAGGLRPHEGGRTVVLPQVPIPDLRTHRPQRGPTWGGILSPGVVQPRVVVRPPPVTIIIQPAPPQRKLLGWNVCEHFADGRIKSCHFVPADEVLE